MYRDEVILKACEIVVIRGIGKQKTAYLDKLLQLYERNGITTVKDIENEEANIKRDREQRYRVKEYYTQNTPNVVYPKNPLYHKFPEEELKPCPFCGGKDIMIQNQYSQKADSYYSMVVCNVCGARTRSVKNEDGMSPQSPMFFKSVVVDEVKALWNTRIG